MFAPREMMARLRLAMGSAPPGLAGLPRIAQLIADEGEGVGCAIYVLGRGEVLERVASGGADGRSGRRRLRVGEGIVGLAASAGQALNVPDLQTHPAGQGQSEAGAGAGAEAVRSVLALPVRRAGRTLGVLAVHTRAFHQFSDLETEVLDTVAMVVADLLAGIVLDGADGARLEGARLEGVGLEGPGPAQSRRFAGSTAVPGLIVGPVVLHGQAPAPARLLAEDPGLEIARLDAALDGMRRELERLISRAGGAAGAGGGASREVLEAMRLVAADDGWMRRARTHVEAGLTAEAAVYRVAEELKARMRGMTDPYLRERVADLEDLAGRVLQGLGAGKRPRPAPGAVLVARRLGAADLLAWHEAGIGGVVVEDGTGASHAAILARAVSLPMLNGVGGVVEAALEGDQAVLNADEGQFLLRPDAEQAEAYRAALRARAERRERIAGPAPGPTVTRDGTRVRLMLNLGLPLELDQLGATGAEGVGLFRTEILMLAAGEMLDGAAQRAIYRRVLEAAGERPVRFRTLDLGGDKMLPRAGVAEAENPAMGWRSLRVGLDRPSLLRRQLRAMIEAAAGRTLAVMFPMVATIGELEAARAVLVETLQRVRPAPARVEVGVMLEVPSLLLQLEVLAGLVDFVSVGTNDLMQFLFAADRSAPQLAGRYDVLSPPVLAMLARVQTVLGARGVRVCVCGAMAARPLEALVLATLGTRELSMPAAAILPVKAALMAADLGRLEPLLREMASRAGDGPFLRTWLGNWAHEAGLAL